MRRLAHLPFARSQRVKVANLQRSPVRTNRARNSPIQWYLICPRCNAKGFSPDRPTACPRCGCRHVHLERARCPWKAEPQTAINQRGSEMTKNVQGVVPPVDRAGEPLLINADTVAGMLGISTRSVWRLLSASKLLEPVRIGGSVRWRKSEVARWVALGCPASGVRDNEIDGR